MKNMKKLKRLVALALSVVMVLAMSVMAFADEPTEPTESTYTITIKGAVSGHTYEAYQIFSGALSGGKLTNIKWGNGVNEFSYNEKNAAKDIASVLKDNNVKDFAKVAGANLTTITSGTYSEGKITGLSAGYYLVKDKDGSVTGQDTYTDYILKVAGNVEVSPKTSVPTVEKKVKENVKSTNDDGKETDTRIPTYKVPAKYNDVADYNIGDDVPFQLIGTMPSNIDSYDHYYYEFDDTLSKGLKYNGDAVVKINDTIVPASITTDGTSLKVVLMDVKALAGVEVKKDSFITVDYTAKLNSAAKIGLPGNKNEVELVFSNNPNNSGDGKTKPGDTGKTPKDTVIVFTYELDTEKVDGTNNDKKLKNAEFILSREKTETNTETNSEYAVVSDGKLVRWKDNKDNATKLVTDKDGLIKVAGLDDGTYYLEETKAPEGYNKLTGLVEVVITAATANSQAWTSDDPKDALINLGVKTKNPGAKDYVDGIVDNNKDIGKIKIANNIGSTLPSTGGIGTTIFYVVGAILMVGAAVLLITKRRAEN